ncbi:WG repeat-containing protein [Actibacterium pelagium]|uniref:WG containing repeat-containing protein n=1 Tax=Actibacterium pelagium TaxID=2029103 RepID=A0A917AJQ0_9RHOB|nr:WG repeat-containing protein [Actibacterium pelagium]GGE57880.1 hypothetical protein GCM10011517_27100 [Actibacterium pelagium]
MGTAFSPLGLLISGFLALGAAFQGSAQDTPGKGVLYPILVDDKWGFISESGDVIAEPAYDSLKGLRFPIPGCTDLRFAPNVLGADGPVAVANFAGGAALKWGFVSAEGEIIPPGYDEVYGFHDGVAAVSREGKWGFIDTTGKDVIPFDYDFASGFRAGVSIVMVDGWWGLIDREARYVVEPKYDVIRFLSHGPYVMFETKGKQGVMHVNGDVLAEAQFDRVNVLSEGLLNVYVSDKAGYYNVERKAFEFEPEFDMAAPFNEGVAQIRIGNETGFIDRNGTYTVELQEPNKQIMSNFGQFHFDWPKLSPIRKYIDLKRGKKVVGLIDVRTGSILIEPSFASIGMVYDDRAVFEDSGKFGYLDATGKIVIPAKFQAASDFSGGLAFVRYRGDPAYIDKEGEIAIMFDEKRVRGSPFRLKLAFVYGDGRERYIDRDGTAIYSFRSGCK